MTGDDHDLGVGQISLRLPQNSQSIHALHFQVGEDEIRLFLLHEISARAAAGGNEAFVANTRQAFAHKLGMIWLIIDYQDFKPLAGFGFRGGRRLLIHLLDALPTNLANQNRQADHGDADRLIVIILVAITLFYGEGAS